MYHAVPTFFDVVFKERPKASSGRKALRPQSHRVGLGLFHLFIPFWVILQRQDLVLENCAHLFFL